MTLKYVNVGSFCYPEGRHSMTLREQFEKREHDILSPYASFSDQSQGREHYEEPCDLRPVYQRDRDRILHCKSFRRLKGIFIAGGRSLPNPADTYVRGVAECQDCGKSTLFE